MAVKEKKATKVEALELELEEATDNGASKPKRAASKSKTKSSYEAADIQTLKDLEAVRKRPGMYIGGTGQEGFMHLVWELLDNAIDEASAGFCSKLNITFYKDGSIEISDNGRGIPVDLHPGRKKVTALEVVFTELHAGGKFKTGAYGATGGLHGVGASVVNALSTELIVEVDRNGKTWRLGFQDGVAGKFTNNDIKKKFTPGHELEKVKSVSANKTGTRVRFWPNRDLFDPSVEIDYDEVCSRIKRVCCLVPGLKAEVINKRTSGTPPFNFVSRNGLPDLLKENLGDRTALTKPLIISGMESFTEQVQVDGKTTKVERECEVEIALLWTDDYQSDVQSFVNTISTPDGGTHILGFDKALMFTINKTLLTNVKKLSTLAKENTKGNLAKKEDIYEGLMAAIKVSFPEPQFKGQTKQELGTPKVQSIVYQIANKRLTNWFQKEGPKAHVNLIKDKIANAIIAREAARQTRDNKRKATSAINSTALPNKLADCRTHGEDSELILVEGDSAAGPAKAGRDSEFMAILPLRGKIVNASKASQKQVLDNAEAQSIFMSLGAGIGNEVFDLEKSRYGRLVILCDADVDGSHIRCLLLTLIYNYLRPLLEAGRVYAAQPPLYKTRIGNETYRAFSEEERDALTKKLSQNRKSDSIVWQRFKGLGEMNVDELEHCALNPETRVLKQITLTDAKKAKDMIDILMGSETSRRQKYLTENGALSAEVLDI